MKKYVKDALFLLALAIGFAIGSIWFMGKSDGEFTTGGLIGLAFGGMSILLSVVARRDLKKEGC